MFPDFSGHSEHQYVFGIRCDVFAYYVLRIAFYVFTYCATMSLNILGIKLFSVSVNPELGSVDSRPASSRVL
jgi:hypothetical protein